MPHYTDKDLRALEDLMNFDGPASPAPADGGQGAPSVDYERTDIDQFNQLMNFGTSARQATPAIHPGSAAETGRDRYSDSDLQMFDRLLPPSHGGISSGAYEKSGDGSAPTDSGAPNYSMRDLESFRELMQFSSGSKDEPAAAIMPRPQTSYVQQRTRDAPARVATIKIVDTDKLYERERRNFLSGQAPIRIVFSDT